MAVPPERSLRSVFVGNIPYEASEEQLKEIFSDVGPVVSFRLVFDRDTGKPKGYGFCEYKDQETAVSAMRNLNNYELNGRTLRVDSAASEKNKEEEMIASAPPEANPYGPAVPPNEAPSAITQAVASLPPEQMFELMKQMKLCIQNNPEEARQMLLQNPQLSYALLQAQVVMKIVNPEIAQAILYRQADPPQPLQPEPPGGHPPPSHLPPNHPDMRGPPGPPDMRAPPDVRGPPPDRRDMRGPPDVRGPPMDRRDARGPPDDRGGPPDRRGPRDMRGPPGFDRPPDSGEPRRNPDFRGPGDFRGQDRGGPDFRDPRGFDRGRGPPDDRRGPPEPRPGPPERSGPPDRPDPRSGPRPGPPDPRNSRGPEQGPRRDRPGGPPPHIPGPEERFSGPPPQWNKAGPPPAPPAPPPVSVPSSTPPVSTSQPGTAPSTGDAASHDQEKAALIMQVLSLTEQQISLLPDDQRQSIMVLKEQIARSSQ